MVSSLTLGMLQQHITRRSKQVESVTIKKELDTFRSVWNWGLAMRLVGHPFPCRGLAYAM